MSIVPTKSKIISVGAGVQSSYLALTEQADYYIFADTGDEAEETYQFITSFLIPEMKKQNKILTIVKWWELYNKPQQSMYEYYLHNNGIPTRQFRSCTDRFKIRTIRKYLRNEGITQAEMLLGITIDEYKRMKPSDVKWITNLYPLIDRKITRSDLIKYWNKKYNIVVPKSGCWYCPYLKPSRFMDYIRNKPLEREKIIKLENNAMKLNPKLILFVRPIEVMVQDERLQTGLDQFDWEDEFCDSGVCFT